MKLAAAITAAVLGVVIALALSGCNPVTTQQLANGDKEFRQRWRIDGLAVNDGGRTREDAADECPNGYDVIADRSERINGDDYRVLRVRCRPAP
jgi:hypothetical protein